MACRAPGGRPADQSAHPRALPSPARRPLTDTFGNRQLSAITPKDVREWHAATLTDKPTMRSHAYSLLRTIMASAVNDELIDANPCRIVGAGRANRVHKIRPASCGRTRRADRGDARTATADGTWHRGVRCGSGKPSNYAAATST